MLTSRVWLGLTVLSLSVACQRKPTANLGNPQNDSEQTAAADETYVPVDADGDGFDSLSDCDDNNPDVNPYTPEIPGNNIDDDCNPNTLPLEGRKEDRDGDGFDESVDCDDDAPLVHPGAREIADNGIDDDCDPSTTDDVGTGASIELDQTACDLTATHAVVAQIDAASWSLDFRLEPQAIFGAYKTIAKGEAPIDFWMSDVKPGDTIAVVVHFTDPLRSHPSIPLERNTISIQGTSADTLHRAAAIAPEVATAGSFAVELKSAGIYGDQRTGELAGLWIDLTATQSAPGDILGCIATKFTVPPAYDHGPDLPEIGELPVQTVRWKVKVDGNRENVSLFGP